MSLNSIGNHPYSNRLILQEEAAEANRRLADVLLSINSDQLLSFQRSSGGVKNQRSQPKEVRSAEPLEISDEFADEYSNDFEDSQEVKDGVINKNLSY